jgi:hypothetical protein
MRSDELHALVCQFRVQSVRLIGVIANETGWKLPDEPISKRRVYQFDFMRRGALDVNGDRTPVTIGDGHDLDLLPRFVLPAQAPPRLAGEQLPSMNASCRSK